MPARRENRTRKLFAVHQMLFVNHAQCGGIDEIHMAAHQFSERRLGAALSVGAQQLGVLVRFRTDFQLFLQGGESLYPFL
jgi:hypothetical protein